MTTPHQKSAAKSLISAFVISFILSFALLSLAPASAMAEELERTISVSGMGEVKAKPDLVSINVGVSTSEESAKAALEKNNRDMMGIFESMASLGIVDDNIKTSNFSVRPLYERVKSNLNGSSTNKVIGYQVNNSVRISTTNIDELGSILDRLVTLGANQINGIQFGFSDATKLQNEARKKAVADARAKAKLYAEEAGVTLGKVMVINEGYSSSPRPMARMEMAAFDSAVPIAAGQETVSAQVSIVFEIK